MQHPVAAEFNFETVRMEMTSFLDLWLNPVAQSKFLHTLAAGYSTGAMFVLGISAFYLLKGRDIGFAKRSFSVASNRLPLKSTLLKGLNQRLRSKLRVSVYL